MVNFNHIPANIRVPLFYAEVDGSQASSFQIDQRALMIGQMLAAGTAPANEPMLITSIDEAREAFGAGSALAAMIATYRANDGFGTLWALPVADAGGATKAEGTITITGTATAAGTLVAYIAGRRVRVGVASGDLASVVGDALMEAINADTDMQVTAADDDAGEVTITAKHGGAIGNDIDIRLNYLGNIGGEKTPAGLTIDIVPMAGGATNPDLTAALAAIGDEEFDFVASAFADTANLNLFKTEWDDENGRWSWARQIYGHVFAGVAGTEAELVAFGDTRNDRHVTLIGSDASPTPPWEWAAAWTAQASGSVREDAARPWQTLRLTGVKAPTIPKRFTLSSRNTLLFSGIATWAVASDGTVMIERSVTTYQENAFGQDDPSFLDVQTAYQLMEIIRRLRQVITTKYARHKLANDGTRFGAGSAIVTPSVIKAELINQYGVMESAGLVENMAAFKANLIVERSADPNRLDVLFAPDLINQLRVFALLAQFRLQYPTAA
jgi:phage tail sheath gpL-like